MSISRWVWAAWSAAWAALWALCAYAARPRPGCVERMLVVTNGRTCLATGQVGHPAAAAGFTLLAVISVVMGFAGLMLAGLHNSGKGWA